MPITSYSTNFTSNNKTAETLKSDDYRYFINRLDSWTQAQIERARSIKDPLTKEAEIDWVFLCREKQIAKKMQELFPKEKVDSFINRFLKLFI